MPAYRSLGVSARYGGDVQQEASILVAHPFAHPFFAMPLTEYIRNPGRILQMLQHTFKDISYDSDDFHKRIQINSGQI